ncbi:MAG TPA: hypothetical protein VLG47_05610 [Candidatus Saccharimonadales bacterium]|nr:hypothetical protein [Candidatus Saccharimonadales bacterium]
MQQSLLILGRQPALGLAELESLYGADMLQPIGTEAALLDIEPPSVDFFRLGGSIKLCKVFGSIEATKWPDVQRHLEEKLPLLASSMPDGKITLGLSAYGLNVKPQQLLAAGLTIKKLLRSENRSVRLVPNQTPALNSAQVLHNGLTKENGIEIVLIRDGGKTIISQTVAEQDIESYTLRDRGRPKRDARVGMLPPKLAQIIINLAYGKELKVPDPLLLDPFCGTGVVLQEAALMGLNVFGTDIDQRMIDYTQTNFDWLKSMNPRGELLGLEAGDATSHKWSKKPDTIACEAYLGRPFTSTPQAEVLAKTAGDANIILTKFLQNLYDQIDSGTPLCIAVPAWQNSPGKFTHLPLIDRLGDLGYNRVRFELVRNEELLYYREDQIVARELLVLTRK